MRYLICFQSSEEENEEESEESDESEEEVVKKKKKVVKKRKSTRTIRKNFTEERDISTLTMQELIFYRPKRYLNLKYFTVHS